MGKTLKKERNYVSQQYEETSLFFLLGAALKAGGTEAVRNDCQNQPSMSEVRSTCGSVMTEE